MYVEEHVRDVGGSLGTRQRRCECWKSFMSPISTLYHWVAVSMSTWLCQRWGHIELITTAVCNYASLACTANCRGCCSAKQRFLVLPSDPQCPRCLNLQSFHTIYSPAEASTRKPPSVGTICHLNIISTAHHLPYCATRASANCYFYGTW